MEKLLESDGKTFRKNVPEWREPLAPAAKVPETEGFRPGGGTFRGGGATGSY